MRDRYRLRLAATLGLAALLAAAPGCKDKNTGGGSTAGSGGGNRPAATATGNSVTGDTIPVGEYASLTGSTATFGTETHQGISLAIDAANAAGGVNGKKITLVTLDDASRPEQAQTVVTKLCTDNKVVAVLGEVASTRSMRGGAICQKYGVPMISPSSTNPKVTSIGNDVFRVCFTDDFQAAVDAHFAHDQGWKQMSVFTDIKNDYSTGFAKYFTDEYKKLGDSIAGEQSYQEGDTDFRAQLATLKGQNPQAILIPGYYTEVGTIARQARDAGLKVPLLGGDGWDSPQLVPGAGGPGGALEGCFFSDHYFSVDLPDPAVQAFVKAYKARFNANPDALAALGYDAANLLVDAMKRAKTLDSAGIRQAIAETKDFPGVTGKITIDADGNARKAAVILQIVGDKFKVFKTYTPEQIGK